MASRRQSLILLLLSAAAGCVDAMGFLASTVFPANMTGNSVVLALSLVRDDMPAVALSGLVLAGFVAGAFAASLWLAKTPKGALSARALGVATALLLVDFAAMQFFGLPFGPWLLLLASIAMGIQGAAVLKLGVPGISTTVVTGALTLGMAQLAARVVQRSSPAPPEAGALPIGSWLAYGLGALCGGLYETKAEWLALALPVALTILAVVISKQGPAGSKPPSTQ